jgi:hypothetical protein
MMPFPSPAAPFGFAACCGESASIDAERLAQLAQLRQRLDAPARRVLVVGRIPADVLDAMALEVVQARRVGGRPLAADDHRRRGDGGFTRADRRWTNQRAETGEAGT